MVHATASAETFYGGLTTVLGAALVMASFIETGMTPTWARNTGALSATLIGIGTLVSLIAALKEYGSEHRLPAAVVAGVFLFTLAFLLRRILCANRASKQVTAATKDEQAEVESREQARQRQEHVSDGVHQQKANTRVGDGHAPKILVLVVASRLTLSCPRARVRGRQ